MTSSYLPFMEWRDLWNLDVAFMDEDHRMLARLLASLARDYGPEEGRPALPLRRPDAPPLTDALEDFARHTHAHFQREEAVMRAAGYRDPEAHRSEHDELLAELTELTRELKRLGVERLGRETLENFKDWFLGHLLEQDRQLADFLKHGGPPAGPMSERNAA